MILETLLRRIATGTKGNGGQRIRNWDWWLMAEALRKSVGPRFELDCWSFFPCHHSSEQCFQDHYRALATPAYTELAASMARQRQLASSTRGLQVHATRWSPTEPTTTTSTQYQPRGVGLVLSGRWIAAHLRPVQKAMEDKGFMAGTNGSWLKLHKRV